MADYEDPGWGRALRGIGWSLIPIGRSVKPWRGAQIDLIALRRQWLNIITAMFLFLVTAAFVEPWDGVQSRWAPAGVTAIGIICLFYVSRLQRRPLRLESQERLAASYRTLFFVGLGPAVVPTMFAMCGVYLVGSAWIYLVGLPFTLGCLALIAPTRRNIERRQQEIQTLGSPLSLGQALMDQSPPGRN